MRGRGRGGSRRRDACVRECVPKKYSRFLTRCPLSLQRKRVRCVSPRALFFASPPSRSLHFSLAVSFSLLFDVLFVCVCVCARAPLSEPKISKYDFLESLYCFVSIVFEYSYSRLLLPFCCVRGKRGGVGVAACEEL
ncbi:unnamed protein product [Laminaria digitata]